MENDEKKPVISGENGEFDLADVPEPLREMFRARMEAKKARNDTPGSSKITIHKDLQFNLQGGSGLAAVLNLLIKVSQPPKPRAPAAPSQPAAAASSEERQRTYSEPPNSGAVKPSSSGWLIWVIAIILAVTYLISSRALGK